MLPLLRVCLLVVVLAHITHAAEKGGGDGEEQGPPNPDMQLNVDKEPSDGLINPTPRTKATPPKESAKEEPVKDATPAKKKLCFSAKQAPKTLGCTDYVGDIASDLKQNGPKFDPATTTLAARADQFKADYCDPKTKLCAVYFTSATDALHFRAVGDSWLFQENDDDPFGWQFMPTRLVSRGTLVALTSSGGVTHSGSEVAFTRLGIAALLRINIEDINDLADLPCAPKDGSPGSLKATNAYLVARGVPFYTSMYGKAFSANQLDPLVAAAKTFASKALGMKLRRKLCGADAPSGQFCDWAQVNRKTTWQQLMTKALEACKWGGFDPKKNTDVTAKDKPTAAVPPLSASLITQLNERLSLTQEASGKHAAAGLGKRHVFTLLTLKPTPTTQ